MRTFEENLTLLNHTIYSYTAVPNDTARANVLLVHGLGEHCRRYDHVILKLAAAGFAVAAFDHIGHGRSGGKRGVYRYETAWELIGAFRDRILAENPERPLFLYGHSLGGALVLTYAQRFPDKLRGVVATSPGLGTVPGYPNILVSVLGKIGRAFPTLTVNNGLPSENLYHQNGNDRSYEKDQYNHSRIALALAYDLITFGRDLVERPDPFPLPLLLMQGGADRCVDAELTARFARKKGNETVAFKFYPDGYHELHNEPFREEIIETIVDWIGSRI